MLISFEEFSACMRDKAIKELNIELDEMQKTKEDVLSNIEKRHKALDELLSSIIEEKES